jgi:hypothetical protein
MRIPGRRVKQTSGADFARVRNFLWFASLLEPTLTTRRAGRAGEQAKARSCYRSVVLTTERRSAPAGLATLLIALGTIGLTVAFFRGAQVLYHGDNDCGGALYKPVHALQCDSAVGFRRIEVQATAALAGAALMTGLVLRRARPLWKILAAIAVVSFLAVSADPTLRHEIDQGKVPHGPITPAGG